MSRIDDTIRKIEESGAYCEEHAGLVLVLRPDEDAGDPRDEWGADEDSPDVDSWRAGEVYWFELLTPDGRFVDSLSELYGWDYALDAAREAAGAQPYVRRAGHYPRLGMAVTS